MNPTLDLGQNPMRDKKIAFDKLSLDFHKKYNKRRKMYDLQTQQDYFKSDIA